jgi:hypothetical protein
MVEPEAKNQYVYHEGHEDHEVCNQKYPNPSYCYPKTKTNMFVVMSSMRKFSGDRRLSDSDMPPAKAQRRQVRKKCHFDRREKSFLDPSYSLGLMGMGSSPLGLCAFAGDNSAFGCGCSPTGEPLFPSEVWEKACTTMAQSLRGLRKFCKSRKFSDSDIPRAKSPRRQRSEVFWLLTLRLRVPSATLRTCFAGNIPIVSVAAMPRWGLRELL